MLLKRLLKYFKKKREDKVKEIIEEFYASFDLEKELYNFAKQVMEYEKYRGMFICIDPDCDCWECKQRKEHPVMGFLEEK